MESVGLNENNVAEFLENFVDTGVKIIDELNLFEDDGLFASVPYGKIVNFVTKKIIQIANPNEALKKAVALAIATNFINGVQKCNISVTIEDENNFKNSLNIIKENLKRYEADIKVFDIDNFIDNIIVQKYLTDLEYIFNKYLNEFQIYQLLNYRNNYLKLDFLKIVESQKIVYEKLNNIFKSESYKEYQKIYRKYSYLESLKNLYNDIVLNDETGMTLADIYIEPYFRIHEYCLSQKFIENNKNRDYYNTSFFQISKSVFGNYVWFLG